MGKNRDRVPNREPIKPIEPIVEETPLEAVEEEPVKEVVEEPAETVVDAMVDGVDVALNIRKDPEVKANNQIAILGKGVKIKVVDPEKPVKNAAGEWYKIKIVDAQTKEESNGFAMRKYIKII